VSEQPEGVEVVPVAVALGRNIADLRHQKGATQDDLARLMHELGYPWIRSTVAAVEAGKREPSIGELAGLCSILRVSAAALVGGKTARPRVRLGRGAITSSAAARAAIERGAWFRPEGVMHQLFEAEYPGLAEALQKAARALGVPIGVVALVGTDLWGRSLVDERERRLGDVDGLSPRAVQARRGHVTRALIAELRAALEAERDR
jgi:transcriptional regulator with XRE-family HTH domain